MPARTKDILDLLFALRSIRETALSPDGRRVAWVETRFNSDRTESHHSLIQVLDPGDPQPRRITAGDGAALHAEKALRWSPDGTWVAFLSDREAPPQLQLYVMPAAGGSPAQRVTSVSGQLESPQWSPDGRAIALLFIEGLRAPAGAIAAAARDDGEVTLEIHQQRLLWVELATGLTRIISPSRLHVYEYDWAPDSRTIAYTAASGSGDNNYWLARLFLNDTTGAGFREIYRPESQLASPRWSPDGRTVAVIQGLMSDQALTGGDIWAIPADGAPARNLTPGRASSPSWLRWLDQPNRLLFTEWVDGATAVATLDPASGQTETLWRGDQSLGTGAYDLSLAVAADGRASAAILSSWDRPPEVWSGRIGAWIQRTELNRELRPLWGRTERIRWSNEGYAVQGWLLYPAEFDPSKLYPMIVSVHGGPAAQRCPSWPEPGFNPTIMAAEGYFVFFPNPRGSFGQGEAFTRANVGDLGHGDLRDIMAGIDHVLASAPVDARRLGIAGWSYGGFMAMWAVTQTGRFRAAVAGAGIANWQSYYGQNLIDQWMIPYFGATVYDDPAAYARSSPICHVKQARTPTLIFAGERDKACPAAQSHEFWHALKALGVETKLVIYADEGHGLRQPAHLEDLLKRMTCWFNEHLQ